MHPRPWSRLSLMLLAALPALVPLVLVFKYGVDCPHADEWDPDIAGLYIKFHQHQLAFSDLVAQHNEHRIVIPRIILLALNSITHFNTVAEMVLEWLILCITSLGFLRLIERTHEQASKERVLGLWLLCNLLIFTPAQWENLLWGLGVVNVLPMALIVWLLVVLLRGRGWIDTSIGIALAAAATYSSGNGFLAWPMGIAVLSWPRLRQSKAHVIAWIMAGVVFIGLYFVGYRQPDHHGSHPYASDLVTPLNYLLNFLGSPFAYSTTFAPQHAAAVTGTMLTLIFLAGTYHAYRSRDERVVVWLAVGFFAIASGSLAAVTRAGFTPWQAIQSTRYVTFALYLAVAVVVMAPMLCPVRAMPAIILTLVVLLEIFCYPAAIDSCKVEYRTRLQNKGIYLLMDIVPDDPLVKRQGWADPELDRQEARALSEMGWLRPRLIQSSNASLIQETDREKLAHVKGLLERGGKRSATELAVMGWAAFTDEHREADAVFLTYDDPRGEPIIFAIAELGIRRDDVARDLGDAGFTPSGWLAVFPPSKLPRDMKSVTVRAWALDTSTGKAALLPGTVALSP